MLTLLNVTQLQGMRATVDSCLLRKAKERNNHQNESKKSITDFNNSHLNALCAPFWTHCICIYRL